MLLEDPDCVDAILADWQPLLEKTLNRYQHADQRPIPGSSSSSTSTTAMQLEQLRCKVFSHTVDLCDRDRCNLAVV